MNSPIQKFQVEATSRTPKVNLDHETGKIEIKGRSIPENTIGFWGPVLDWLQQYTSDPKSFTEAHFCLDYFNTSSTKCILDSLRALKRITDDKKGTLKVNWYYEDGDDDMYDAGVDFRGIVKISEFEIIMILPVE